MAIPKVQTDEDGNKVVFTIDPNDEQDFVFHLGAVLWASATSYTYEQFIRAPNGKVYQARESHTSGATFSDDIAKWQEYKPGLYLDDESGELIDSIEIVEFRDSNGDIVAGELQEVTTTTTTADQKSVIYWLTGGTAGATYYVTTRIATDSSPVARKREFSFQVKVSDY